LTNCINAIASRVEPLAQGNGGNINIRAGELSLNNFGTLSTSTFSRGNAGNIAIQVDDAITLSCTSSITNIIGSGGIGKGGNINVQARSLTLTDGSSIQANLSGGIGNGGTIRINTSDFVKIFGLNSQGFSSGLTSDSQRGANGSAGDIFINTRAFHLTDGGLVRARTFNSGKAGNIIVNANTFEAINSGQIIVRTSGGGTAGDIRLNVSDRILISNRDSNFPNIPGLESGLFASTTEGSTGDGGSIFINPKIAPGTVVIEDGGIVTVSSQGTGIGGQIQIKADNLTLNEGNINAETASTQGGNIALNVQDLLSLRNEAQISTTAGTDLAGGNGGNIDINARTIFAVPQENSDITANAFTGAGGRVTIDTQNIFGIDFRDRLTPLSDITASSERGAAGEVIINTSGVEPTRGLEKLTEERVNVEVAQGCQVGTAQGGRVSFYNVGRGGLPPSPDDLFDSPIQGEWLSLESEEDTGAKPQTQRNVFKTQPNNSILTFSCSARAER
jgi:large exoprotein involved in heme utilization and adhesion